MKILSPAFDDQESIPARYTCDAGRVSPPLRFTGVPRAARSLVLIMDDIDVPRSNRPGGRWNHWLVWNMPPDTDGIAEDTTPPGISGRTTGGATGYEAPAPPEGEHRYVFRLYALDAMLNLDFEKTRREDLLRAMDDHVIAEAELTGRYRRQAVARGGMLSG